MAKTVQRFDLTEIPTEDGYKVNLSGIITSKNELNGFLALLKKNFTDVFSKKRLVNLVPIIEEDNANGKKLTEEIKILCDNEGLKFDDLKVIILSSATNGKRSKSSRFDTDRLENMTIQKKKSLFSRLLRR